MKEISIYVFAASVIVFLAAGIWVWMTRRQLRKIMRHLGMMLEEAESGSFEEHIYDESLLSSIEIRMAHFLSASKVSAENLIEEKEKTKRLISDISHQTKTPIASLLLYTQMLEEQALTEDAYSFVREISRQTQKLNFLVTSMVKASRLETGIFVLHPKQEAVSPMLEEVLGQIMPRAEQKNLAVAFTPQDIHAFFDRKWTMEAVYNILENAVKYTPADGTITVSLLLTDSFVRMEIRDTGIGIAEADTAKIFKRFYRAASVSGEEGVGIGLYLARQIIAEENGFLKVKSKEGEGSSFFVYLPLK